MEKWPTETKVLGGFGVALAVLGFVGWLAYNSTADFINTSRSVARSHEVLASLEEIFSLLNQAETRQRAYIITGDESYLQPRHAAVERVGQIMARLQQTMAGNPAQLRRLPELSRRIEARLELLDRALDARRTQGFDAARQRIVIGSGRKEMEAIHALIADVENEEKKLLAQRQVAEQENARKTVTTFSVTLLFAVGFLALLFLRIKGEIVERKQAAERQAQLLHELESANEELKNFAYVVSHDLKAPLRAISSLADWISTDYEDKFDDEGREQLRLLMNRVRRMDGLIDGILQYSRVGRVREARAAVDLDQLVHGVIDLLAPPPHIRITVEDHLPTVVLEPTRIQQVFQNLLSNAIKYMDKPAGDIRIRCIDADGEWKFGVSDNGPGIEPRHFEKIFQLFQTLAPRDRVEGAGVGLALVKKIVEMYGGKIWVESRIGEGTTFFFTLPKHDHH